MKLADAKRLALDLMAEHGLTSADRKTLDADWRFGWSNAKTIYGQCSYRKHTIFLSRPLTERSEPEYVRDTILHEIAHALVGPGHGHSAVWKRMARTIGANPKRTSDHASVARKWIGTCPGCGKQTKRHRRNHSLACGPCCREWSGGQFDPQFQFVWSENTDEVANERKAA